MLTKFSHDLAGNTLAVVVLLGMIASVISIAVIFVNGKRLIVKSWYKWAIPILAVIGLGISIYLSYVELYGAQPICGPIGDCSTVQKSPYAYLFGVIPVGIVGGVGYAAILIGWIIYNFGPVGMKKLAALAVWCMAWFGVLFCIYLTFLEPFVIGATCIWCVSSAVVMTLLLLISTPAALEMLTPGSD
jgi:uncharacterized membrane protein